MNKTTSFLGIIPVLPSADLKRDIAWHQEKTGFKAIFSNEGYAVLHRDNLSIHLQWHAGTKNDPVLGGSVIRIFVDNIQPIFKEFVNRGTVTTDKLQENTPWNTNEFGFYDLNNNAIIIVTDSKT